MTTEDLRQQIRRVTQYTDVGPGDVLSVLRECAAEYGESLRRQRDALDAALGDTPAKPRAKREPKASPAFRDSADKYREDDTDRSVLAAIPDDPRGVTVQFLAAASGVTEHYVRQALERLVPGKVTREKAATGRGWRYGLVKSEAAQ